MNRNPPAVIRYDDLPEDVKTDLQPFLVFGTRRLNALLDIHVAAFGERYVSFAGYRIEVIRQSTPQNTYLDVV